MAKEWDVFISHASEDKRAVALPLEQALRKIGLKVWLDQHELSLGDSLRGKISEGLAKSRFGVVILSPAFFEKQWPLDELRALMAREEAGHKVLLPLRHAMSQQDLVRADPLIADRLGVAYEDGLDAVVAAIVQAVGRPASARAAGGWVVDFSHGQREWHYLVQFFERDPRFTKLTLGLLEQADLVSGASVLVMPPPMKSRLEASEIDCIEQRVDGGMGLLLMGCYAERHHETNFSELTWRFDLEFLDDVVLPAGIGDHELRSHVFSRDPRWAAKIRLDGGSPHPVLAGVHELVFLSAGSIRSTTQEEPELVVRSEPNSRLLRPLGHIPPDGSRPAIDDWRYTGTGAAPLLVAKRFGKGRVVVAGTWKLCTVDHGDNFRLVDNALRWLGGE